MLLKAIIVPTVGWDKNRDSNLKSGSKNINELLEYLGINDILCFFLDCVEEEFGTCKVTAEVPPYPRPASIIPQYSPCV